jgi:Protein of unknown function (DUF2867)
MRLPNSVYEAHPWVIAQIAPDFRLLDAWALPVQGGPDDFDAFLDAMGAVDPVHGGPSASRFLFWARLRLGEWFGWDDPGQKQPIPGCTETTLSARLPAELKGSGQDTTVNHTMQRVAGGFEPVYRTRDEAAAEISNGTVHGVLHLTWVQQGDGRYRAHMGVYVKPRGRLGAAYMAFISPFRHLVVYPALMRHIGQTWQARDQAGGSS